MRNSGSIRILPADDGNLIHLETGYVAGIPGIGGILEQAMGPFVSYGFGTWLADKTTILS